MRRCRSFLLVAIFMTTALLCSCAREREKPEIIFLSGSGMKVPITEIAANFERETGIRVQTHFEGSAILHDYIVDFNTGDIFLPGDKKNLDDLQQKGLVKESFFLAWHVLSILVAPNMAERIKGLDDLAEPGIRLAMSNPRQASPGRFVMQQIIEKHPRGEEILNNVIALGSSSQEVLKLYRQGGIDAVIEWDVLAATPEGKGLIVVPLVAPYQLRDELHAALLSTAKNPAAAEKFYTYLRSNGREVFQRHGYDTRLPGE